MSPDHMAIAVRYDAAYPDDQRVDSNAEVARREERLWAARQNPLRRTT